LCSLEPLWEQQGAPEIERKKDGKHQADDVLVVHSRSTNFCTSPSRANTATVSAMNANTPMSSPFSVSHIVTHIVTQRPHRVSRSTIRGEQHQLSVT
jgi:hypothetical protein